MGFDVCGGGHVYVFSVSFFYVNALSVSVRHWEKRIEWLTDKAVIDVRFLKERGAVRTFSCSLRVFVEGQWHQALRYDTTYGHLHRHRFWHPPGTQIDALESKEDAPQDRTGQLVEALRKIRDTWEYAATRVETRVLSEEASLP